MRTGENSTICETCGLEFRWPPFVSGKSKYCCPDCRDGYVCSCHEIELMDDDYAYSGSEAISIYEGY